MTVRAGSKHPGSNNSPRRSRASTLILLLACACLLTLSAPAADSRAGLNVSIRVNPVVLMIVANGTGVPIQGRGNSSATVSLPLVSGKSTVTVNIDASGQPNNNGCTILARLSATTSATVTVNGKQISSTSNIPVADTPAYPSSAKLAIEATGQEPTLPAILLTCQPK